MAYYAAGHPHDDLGAADHEHRASHQHRVREAVPARQQSGQGLLGGAGPVRPQLRAQPGEVLLRHRDRHLQLRREHLPPVPGERRAEEGHEGKHHVKGGPTMNKAFNATRGERAFDVVNILIMLLLVVVTLYPFLNVLAISLNNSQDTVRGGIGLWPRQFTLENYKVIFAYEGLLQGFKVSILRTVVGTVLGLLSASMLAFTLSRADFQARRFVSVFLALTMYFSGGLIPVYILMRDLHLIGTFWVYVLPGMVGAFNVFVIRSFIDGLPFALQESAKLDGANDFTIYWRIILPLAKPALATIALFLAVGQWNAFLDTYLYNGSSETWTTLQYELMKVLQSTQQGGANMRTSNEDMTKLMNQVSPESIKMAITIVVTVPILAVYPFLQRYFVGGMTLGAVKA
ncbi:Protein LplC [Paenibacillus sp. P22]|nr:Protein LplC [Paenibacillus sp. P22]